MKLQFLVPVFALVTILGMAACGQEERPSDNNKQLLDPAKAIQNPNSANGIDTSVSNNMPVITFVDTLHDFGKATEGEKLVYEYRFTNTGKSPLIISAAAGSCGCTAVDYPKDPVAPGQGGAIKAEFNTAGKPGFQTKTITLSTNTIQSTHILQLKAEVQPQQ